MTDGREIVLKLTIDDKEFIAKIDVDKNQLIELTKILDPLEQKFEAAYKKITAELSKYDSANEESVQTLTKWLSTQNLSLDVIEKSITKLQLETKAVDANDASWVKQMAAVQNLSAAHGSLVANYDSLDKTQRKMVPGQQQMSMAMNQFGYVLNDSSVFLLNFRMGLMGVANNIPMIVQMFNDARRAAAATGTTVSQQLTAALAGGGGLIIAINGVMLLLQLLPELFGDTTEAIEKQAEEVKKLSDEYKNLSTVEMQAEKDSLEKRKGFLDSQIKTLNERKETISVPAAVRGGEATTVTKFKYVEDEDNYNKFTKELTEVNSKLKVLDNVAQGSKDRLNQIFSGTFDKSSINNINFALDLLNKELNAVGSEAQRVEIRKTIKELEKLKDSYSGTQSSSEKKFTSDKTKSAAEVFMAITKQDLQKDLDGKDYSELYDELETAITDYNETLSAFRNITNQKDLDAYSFAKDLMEKRIDLIRAEIREKKKLRDDETKLNNEVEGYINKADADYLKSKKESSRYLKEQDAKSTLDPYDQRKNELSADEEVSVERARIYGATEEQILNIHNWYAQQRTQIDFQEQQARLSNWSRTLGQLASMFGKHTAAYKVLASAQVWIEAYKGIAALYAPPPVGVGPLLAPFMSTVLYTMAGVQTANIMMQPTNMPGYATGGILPEGKAGFFEGTHNEIVAPEKDFISVVNDLIGQQRIALRGGSSGSSSEFMRELKLLNENFEKYASRPIPAFITQEQFNQGFTEAEFQARKEV